MTPMLILLFGVTPASAISSDLVAAVVMRPFGALVHLRAGTVNLKLVRWMVIGSVPAAFLGSYLLRLLGHTKSAQHNVEIALGAALLVGASAMVLRMALDRISGRPRTAKVSSLTLRPLPTLAIGVIGGVIVGLTSVGSGSLMIILVLVGSMLSSSVPDRYIRPVIAFVIFASGLKYVGVDTTTLGWALCTLLLVSGLLWVQIAKPWRQRDEQSRAVRDEA